MYPTAWFTFFFFLFDGNSSLYFCNMLIINDLLIYSCNMLFIDNQYFAPLRHCVLF